MTPSRPGGATAPAGSAEPVTAGRVWFPGLDGLRAIAALLVVVFHVAGAVAYFVEPLRRAAGDTRGIWVGAGSLARFGNWGVAIFFVLSGFLLYRPFAAAWLADRPGTPLKTYLARRLARIIPAYWLALTVLLFFVKDKPPPEGALAYALFYGFAQNYRKGYVDMGGGLAVAWTLCIEMSFYLVLPLLAWGLRAVSPKGRSLSSRVKTQLGVLALAAVASIGWRWYVIAERPLESFWLPAHFTWFALGMMVAVGHTAWSLGLRLPSPLVALGRYPIVSWMFGLQVFWLTSLIPVRPWIQTREELMLIFVGNGLSAALLLVPLVFGDQSQGRLRLVLSRHPLKWLGELSYGVYLWHTIWLVMINEWVAEDKVPGGFLVRFTLVMVATVIVSQLSLLLLERPIMDVVQRMTRTKPHAGAAARGQSVTGGA